MAGEVARGYITADAAADYGVVLTAADPLAVDRHATDEVRWRGRRHDSEV